jgi:hypothetical protein
LMRFSLSPKIIQVFRFSLTMLVFSMPIETAG